MVPNVQKKKKKKNLPNWIEKFVTATQNVLCLFPIMEAVEVPHPDPSREQKICIVRHPTFSDRKGQARMLVTISPHNSTFEPRPGTGQTGRTRDKETHSFHVPWNSNKRATEVYNSHRRGHVKVLECAHTFPAWHLNQVRSSVRRTKCQVEAEVGKIVTVFRFFYRMGKVTIWILLGYALLWA